jgi:DNA-binding transcriptional regulator YiaG
MTAPDFMVALAAGGVDITRPVRALDAAVSALFEVDESTARRWRTGRQRVPGPARLALRLMRLKSSPAPA